MDHRIVFIVIHSILMLLHAADALEPDVTADLSAPKSPADIQAEEERILAIHFPNKDDDDSDYDDEDDDDDDAYDEAQAAKFDDTSSLLAAEPHDQLPVFLEQPVGAFCTRQKPATLRCKAAHAIQLHIVCSGHVRHVQTVQDAHVDPQTGVHVQTVTATVGADALLRHAGVSATPYRCDCHAVSPHGKAKSQPSAIVELACEYKYIYIYMYTG